MLKEKESDFEVKGVLCDGIDNIKVALNKMKLGKADFNFLEGMACMGGCVGGPCNLTHEIRDKNDIDKFGKTTTKATIKASLDEI